MNEWMNVIQAITSEGLAKIPIWRLELDSVRMMSTSWIYQDFNEFCDVLLKFTFKVNFKFLKLLLVCSSFVGINELRQMEIFRILSGILHMGNIVVKSEERSADNCSIPVRCAVYSVIWQLRTGDCLIQRGFNQSVILITLAPSRLN